MARADSAKDEDRGVGNDIMAIEGANGRIDDATFEQILGMDDDEEDREFSQSIVFDFFTQAEGTFKTMDEKLESKDLKSLSDLGHFLKGSSATLGLTKVQQACEKIQHYGNKKDESGSKDIAEGEALEKLAKTIGEAKKEFKDVEVVLRKFYNN